MKHYTPKKQKFQYLQKTYYRMEYNKNELLKNK